MRTIKRKYHYFYKITNNLNSHYYYGIHSTNYLNDGYMGSGKRLKYAYEKYGIENFTKEILEFFDTREDAAKHEAEIVNEVLIKDNNCYNIVLGGDKFNTTGTATYKDENGNIMQLPTDSEKVISGEVVRVCKGKLTVKDKFGNTYYVSADDPRYLSGELVTWFKGNVTTKDKFGNKYYVSVDDPRYLSGELKPTWSGRKHKQETIEKVKRTYKEINHQQGEKNSQYGTCWIIKDDISKKIKKEDLINYINLGWKPGRKCKRKK